MRTFITTELLRTLHYWGSRRAEGAIIEIDLDDGESPMESSRNIVEIIRCTLLRFEYLPLRTVFRVYFIYKKEEVYVDFFDICQEGFNGEGISKY